MSGAFAIRPATAADGAACAAIYAPYVERSAVTFEYEAPDAAEMSRRIESTTAAYPWLVCERGGAVLGYAYAHRFAQRAAYAWAAELSVYVAGDARGRGLGRALYAELLALLRRMNCRVALALVSTPNPASERLHEAMGFERLAAMPGVGWKLGAWRDITYFSLRLAEGAAAPAPFIPYPELEKEGRI